jgi:4-hydroxyproline epimerase
MRNLFFCIDGHTAGNPVRLVAAGAPFLVGSTMSERRQDFLARFDWIRNGLMFEPRGHDVMSGGFIYPPLRDDCDGSILFIETSGALPMCGHGSIGIMTFGLEHGLLRPRQEGQLRIEVPAGIVNVTYRRSGNKVTAIQLTNVPSFVYARDVRIADPEFGELKIDVAYGGNFYAIIEPQGQYAGVDSLGARAILSSSARIRASVDAVVAPVHPFDPSIRGVSHVLWSDPVDADGRGGRSAVFYGNNAIDRSPCGTGTCARLAHLSKTGRLKPGETFKHRSFINSVFIGRIEGMTKVGEYDAVVPSIEGSAFVTGYNQLWIDDDEPFAQGFRLSDGAAVR